MWHRPSSEAPSAGPAGSGIPGGDVQPERAVALAVDPVDPSIPTIVATGQGALAREIVDLAFAHGVKVREDRDLVEILSTLKVGDAIPVVSFIAVAEILAHIYRWDLQHQNTPLSSASVEP